MKITGSARHWLIGVSGVLLSLNAMSAERDWTPYGWVDYGSTRARFDGWNAGPAKSNEQPAFGLGVRWKSGFSIEAGHVENLQELRQDFFLYFETGTETASVHTRLETSFVTLGWNWALGQSPWSLNANGGVHRLSINVSGENYDPGYRGYSTHEITYGVGLEYALNDRWRLGLGVQRFTLNTEELDRGAFRVAYRF